MKALYYLFDQESQPERIWFRYIDFWIYKDELLANVNSSLELLIFDILAIITTPESHNEEV